MGYTWLALGLCFVAALADVIGGSLTIIKKLTERQFVHITALGAGFLLAATLLDRLPDSMNELPSSAPVYIVIGYLIVLAMEVIQARTSTAESSSHHRAQEELLRHGHHHPTITKANGAAALVALLIHTFMDGVVIAGAFTMNRATGILMFVAITMHKLPEGFTMATISLASTDSRKRAFVSASLLAVSTMIGAVLTIVFGEVNAYLVRVIMALATGTFLFISTSSLVPLVRDSKEPKTVVTVIVGVAIFYASLLLIHRVGLT